MRSLCIAVVFTSLFAACSGAGSMNLDAGDLLDAGPTDAGAVNTLSGMTAFTPAMARAVRQTALDGGVELASVQVYLTSIAVPDFCAVLNDPYEIVILNLGATDGGLLRPGTFTIPSTSSQVSVTRASVANGNSSSIYTGLSGSITLTDADAAKTAGSFSVTVAPAGQSSGSTLSGTFDAPTVRCP